MIGNESLHSLRLEYVKRKILYDTIKQDAEETRNIVDIFSNEGTGWEITVPNPLGTIRYKYVKEKKLYTFRLDGVLDVPLDSITGVCMEVDLYNTWIPTVMGFGFKQINILNHVENYRKFAHGIISLPWPISNRDACLTGFGVDLMDQGGMLVVAHSLECPRPAVNTVDWTLFPELQAALDAKIEGTVRVNADPITINNLTADEMVVYLSKQATSIPPIASGCVRATAPNGGFLMKPVDATHTAVQFYAEIDPKMDLPNFLINIALRQFAFDTVELLRKTSAKAGKEAGPHTDRINKRAAIYDILRKRLAEVAAYTPEEKEAKRQASMDKLNRVFKKSGALEGDDSAAAATPEPAGVAPSESASPAP